MKYTDTNEDNLSSFIKLLDNSMCHEVSAAAVQTNSMKPKTLVVVHVQDRYVL